MNNLNSNRTLAQRENNFFFLFDALILAFGTSLIVGGVILFNYNPFTTAPEKKLEPIATIMELQQNSKRKIPGSLTWNSILKGDTLYNGDQILTNENSQAQVLFNSGSKLTIAPQSLIRIEVRENEYQLHLVKGQLRFEGNGSPKVIDAETGQSLKIPTGKIIVSSRAGLTTVSEFKKISPRTVPKLIPRIKPEEIKPVEPAEPVETESPSKIIAETLELANAPVEIIPVNQSFAFKIKNDLKESSVIYEVSETEDFSRIITEVSAKNQASITMKRPGIYFVRAKNQDEHFATSQTIQVTVTAPVALIPKDFKEKQVVSEKTITGKVSWQKFHGTKSVIVQLAQDPHFKKLVSQKITSKTSHTFTLSRAGNYYWRVLPASNTPTYFLPSASAPLDILLPETQVPKIITSQILEYKEINGKSNHVIKLLPYENAQEYILEVYSDHSLKKLVFKTNVKSTQINWISSRSGKFFYRVKVKDIWGQVTDYSKTGELIFPISPMVDL